jgi:insulysin
MKIKKAIYVILLPFMLITANSYASVADKSISQTVVDKNPLKILTPSLKNIETRKLILSNEIEVFLISDAEARQSSAAMAVNVGQWNDPEAYPGMAHFCEHMLFMGSKKYPNENYFTQLIHDHGGTNNAYTKTDRTVYMYSIDNDYLDLSLDVFSRFFIDPLLSENCIDRELLAVNQEYNKNRENDNWRGWYIFKTEGNPSHPNARDGCGNQNTLKIIGRDNLEKWYKEHYKSNGMHLVVYSNKDLDTLTALVEKCFCEVEHSKETTAPIPYKKISSPNQEGHMTYIEPVKDLKTLTIAWEIPAGYASDLDKKTYSLIAYALSHRMKGGLYYQLKKEGLIEELSSDSWHLSKNHLLLSINMELTAEGVQKTDHILYTFFQGLNKLKQSNLPSHIYDDLKSVLTTSYKWQSRKNPFEITKICADSMVDEPLATFPYKSVMITDFDLKTSRELLSYLTPYNAMYSLTAPADASHRIATKSEKWMGAKFSTSKMSEDLLHSFANASLHKDIGLPNPNPYISKHQDLLCMSQTEHLLDPVLIASEESATCYYWQDTHYLVPKSQIFIRIKSPEINDSAKSICLNDLFATYLSNQMASLISEGVFADIKTKIYAAELGLNLTVSGYDDKIGSYMMSFLSGLKSAYPTATDFSLIKEQMLSECKSEASDMPYLQAMNLMASIITNTTLDQQTRLKTLESITLEDFQRFQKSIFEENFLKVFISGNIDKEGALLHFSEIKGTLSAKPYNTQSHYTSSYRPFYSQTSMPKKVTVESSTSGNSTVLLIDEGDFSYDKYASSKIFSTIIKEAFFSELRSKQQTGYITGSVGKELNGKMLQYFIVQSTTHYPEELLARYELFLENYSKSMEHNISKDRFEKIKSSIIKNIALPTEDLETYARERFELAYTYDAEFDRGQKLISALEQLTYETFISDARAFISRENAKRLAVLVNGTSFDNKSFSYKETNKEELALIKR